MDNLIEKFSFLKRVNPTLLTLYPLQLANMERLEENDAVFIFDEVGCGKTISSGLMALSYLEQYKNKKVLVITINSLVKTGQFKSDWTNRLPFTDEQKERITIINDHVKRIEYAQKENWGLIIVDEAQLFLSDSETGKGEALKKLKGEKVVFLTATPIRKSERDLDEYIEIADNILKKEYAKVAGKEEPKKLWIEILRKKLSDIVKGQKQTEDNICAKFEPTLPVTRYFKDTVRFLENPDGDSTKNASKRRFAEVWSVVKEKEIVSKEECLLENIESILEKDGDHHFVVFATKQQAQELGEYFRTKGFKRFYGENLNMGDKTYEVVVGENSGTLANYKQKDLAKNPTVLFVNYQIAEQGLNLPGFDYVVNYQISRFPSRLEQRFGRIDRLDKNGEGKYDTINICYVLSDNLFDTSTWNFELAKEAYLESILPFLPSRNMVLTDKVLCELDKVLETTKNSLSTIKTKLEKSEELSKEEKDIIKSIRKSPDREKEEGEEEEFAVEENLTTLDIIERWFRELERRQVKSEVQVKLAKEFGIIRDTVYSDEIFVRYDDNRKTKTLTNKDCEKVIRTTEAYKRYCSLIASMPIIRKIKELHEKKVTHAINTYLIWAFALGDFNALYPLDGYKRQMKRILQVQAEEYGEMASKVCATIKEDNSRRIRSQYALRVLNYSKDKWQDGRQDNLIIGWEPVFGLSEEDKVFLMENAEEFLLRLPIYCYLREAGKQLQIFNGNVYDNGNLDMANTQWVSWNKYFRDNEGYWRCYIEGENGWEPSSILKLFYHYERLEASFYPEVDSRNKMFHNRERECMNLLGSFLDYTEMSDSKEKEIKRREIEERLEMVDCLNKEVANRCGDTSRCVVSWYGNIFNMTKNKVVEKRHNWSFKKHSYEWYADNNNGLGDVWLKDLLQKDTIKKKLDYWSYNLIQEMLLPDYLYNRNPEIMKIYRGDNSEYGFDLDAIGLTREILYGTDSVLAKKVLFAISPWLYGENVPEIIRKMVQ